MLLLNLPKLHLLCDKKETHRNVGYVNVSEDLTIFSTNGYLVCLLKPDELEVEAFDLFRGKAIKREVWEALSEKDTCLLGIDDEGIEISNPKRGKRVLLDWYNPDIKTINYKTVMPAQFTKLNSINIGFNFEQMDICRKALGVNKFAIYFQQSPAKGVVLSPCDPDEAARLQAMLMPVVVENCEIPSSF
jgi:hypothetical protein